MENLVTAFMTGQRNTVVNGVEFTGLPIMEKDWNHKKNLEKARELAEKQLNILYS